MKQTPVCILCDCLISNSKSKDGCKKVATMHVTLNMAIINLMFILNWYQILVPQINSTIVAAQVMS